MLRVVGLGAGGHAKVMMEILQASGSFDIIGILDRKRELHGTEVCGVKVLGDDGLLAGLLASGINHAFIGVGSAGDLEPRKRLYLMARSLGFDVVSTIHRDAVISSGAVLGRGTTIMAGAIVNTGAVIGDNVIINTGAIVEHDCRVGNHVHVATGAKLASTVEVGDATHVGLGACIRQCIRVGQNVIIGAGAVVVADIPDNVTAVGVPARVLRHRNG